MAERVLTIYTDNLEVAKELMDVESRPGEGETIELGTELTLRCDAIGIQTGLVYLERIEFTLSLGMEEGSEEATAWIHERLSDHALTLRIDGNRVDHRDPDAILAQLEDGD